MSGPSRKKTAFIPTIAIGTTLASVLPVCAASCSSGCGGGAAAADAQADNAFSADVSTDFVQPDYTFYADVSCMCWDVHMPALDAGDARSSEAGDATVDAADAIEEVDNGETGTADGPGEGD